MNFKELIIKNFRSFFLNYGFFLSDQRSDYITFKSEFLTVIFVYNILEKSTNVFLSWNDGEDANVQIDNDLLIEFFNFSLEVDEVPLQVLIQNILSFFKHNGNQLLLGNMELLKQLKIFDRKSSQIYTQKIILKQKLEKANIAWVRNNYKLFVDLLEEIDIADLSDSMKLKYQFAKKQSNK